MNQKVNTTTEYLQTSTGEKFYPKTIDSQVEISVDGKAGTLKDELININNKFGGYTTTADLPKTYTPTEEIEKTYLTITNAANTYATIESLNNVDQKFNNYTTTEVLNDTYATIEELTATNETFNNYTTTSELENNYINKEDAANTYLPITELDKSVESSVNAFVNSEEMKSLLVSKEEFNRQNSENNTTFNEINGNITLINNDISNLKLIDTYIDNKISNIQYNNSIREMWHSYNSETKTHILNFAPPDTTSESDLESLPYRHYFFTTTAPWHPGDKLHINFIDLDLIPMNIFGEDLTEEDIFGEGVIVHITVDGNKCFFKSGGTNNLNYKLISGSTYPKSLNSNILYNSYDNSIPGVIKNENGSLTFTEEYDVTNENGIVLPVYLENGKTYTIKGRDDGLAMTQGSVKIHVSVKDLENNIIETSINSAASFIWEKSSGLAYYRILIKTISQDNMFTFNFYPQINEGTEYLNYEQYRTKENTIWVDTIIDKEAVASKEAEINGFQLDCYINASTGVVTKPSSNTCYIKYFPCEANNEYNFKLSNGQTVLIAGFPETPTVGSTGHILYGEGKNTGLSELNYNLSIGSAFKALAIWYYDSGANNNKIPEITITNITKKNQIISTLPDEYKINEYTMASENPWLYYEDVDYILNSTIVQDKYLSASGEITDGDGDNAPCYTENYIPVKYGITYNLNYTLSKKKEMWCRIVEYTGDEGNYTFKKENVIVNRVQGTSQSKTYTPSASIVTAIRISWRTFYPSGTTNTFSFIEPNVEFCTATENDLYIETTNDKENSKEINILKKNKIILNLSKALLFIKGKWEEKNFYVFNNKKFS